MFTLYLYMGATQGGTSQKVSSLSFHQVGYAGVDCHMHQVQPYVELPQRITQEVPGMRFTPMECAPELLYVQTL